MRLFRSPLGGSTTDLTRARMCVVAALLTAILLMAVPELTGAAQAQTAPSRPVDTQITDYVIFGFNTVAFKGSDIAGRGVIQGGNVGANASSSGNNATVNICANKHVTMSDFSQVVGGVVRLSSNCTFWDLFANNTPGSGGATLHSGPTPVTLPVVTEPTFPDITCDPANPVTIVKGSPAATLTPGAYGDVEFQDNTTVTLLPGLYQICNFHAGQNVHVTTTAGTEVRVAGSFIISNDTIIQGPDTVFGEGPACATRVFVRGDGVGANDNTINFAKDTTVAGHFYTNQGKIALGNGTNLYGTFWGRDIISDFDVNVTYCPPVGDFPFTKTVSGSGAGQQGDIQIDITCVPSPPNSSIPPFIIPAGSPAGAYTTVVTGVTLPAVCRAMEAVDGDNGNVVVAGLRDVVTPETVLCPDVGNEGIDPATGHPRSAPPVTLDNVFQTTTTQASTTSSSTTTTTTTSSSTTSSSTTTTTFPQDVCVLPTVITQPSSTGSTPEGGTGALARTGERTTRLAIAGLLLIALGGVLLLGRQRVTR